MQVVGITGKIASGKSLVLKLLANRGYKVFNTDKYVSTLYNNFDFYKKVIKILFNYDTYIVEKIDKKFIADAIYQNYALRIKLENYIHPKVLFAITKFITKYKNKDRIFIEIPLLYEKSWARYFDVVILLRCSTDIRKKRACQSKHMSEQFFNKINDIQISEYKASFLADFVINTNQDIRNIITQLSKLIHLIEK